MKHHIAVVTTTLTMLVLFAIPKAGLYLAGIPITLGYIMVGMMAVAEVFHLATCREREVPPRFILLTTMLMALAVLEVFAFRIFGSRSLGGSLSILVSTVAMPVLSLLFTRRAIRILKMAGVLKSLRLALIAVSVFGIASFFVYNLRGILLGMPFITTTGSDITLVATRHNLRGPFIKMFSTYNNGNILGLNMLLWAPIAAHKLPFLGVMFRSVCVLTLSRSVWVGLFLLDFLGASVEKTYRRVFLSFFAIFALLTTIIVTSAAIGKNPVEFLLDKDLGGRISHLESDLNVISTQRIGWDSESVYAAAYLAFGPLGVFLITSIWLVPVFLGGKEPIQWVARISLLVYLIVSVSEGAFTLVPTQAIYWFVAMIAMSNADLLQPTSGDQSEPTSQDIHDDRVSLRQRELVGSV